MNLKKKEPWVMHTIEMHVMSDYTIHVGWPENSDAIDKEPIKLNSLEDVKLMFAPFFKTDDLMRESMANEYYSKVCEIRFSKDIDRVLKGEKDA